MPLDEAYFVWLYSQVGSVNNENLTKTYWNLARLLHDKEFTWSNIAMDENRAQDGKDLRKQFVRESGIRNVEEGWLSYGCSVLEMLVALSIKLDFQDAQGVSYWFWRMIDNLGLTECNDATTIDEPLVHHILDKVIERDYAKNGAGGLFPLQKTRKDQRRVELWYQAENYLLEHVQL